MILEPRNKEKAELGWENDIESRPSEADLDTPCSHISVVGGEGLQVCDWSFLPIITNLQNML